jgi:hypothetical protein
MKCFNFFIFIPDRVDRVLNENILKFLLFHLKNNEIYIKKEILWVLSNIAGGNSNHVKFLFFLTIQVRVSLLMKRFLFY